MSAIRPPHPAGQSVQPIDFSIAPVTNVPILSTRAHCTMFTTATNFLARPAFVVMPKPARKPAPPQLQFSYPLPYGAILRDGGVQFVVYSKIRHRDAGAALPQQSTIAIRFA